MASWIIHLRIAERVYKQVFIPSVPEFVLGNIAPDSGVPSEDGRGYMPDKTISHFYVPDETGHPRIDVRTFLEHHFTDAQRRGCDARKYSFLFGYLVHLLTDNLWMRDIVVPAKVKYADMYRADHDGFYRMVKRDWYDLDFMFMKNNPDLEAFRIYAEAENVENTYLDFFARDAFENRREFITEFYRSGAANVEFRDTYITPQELDSFVDNAADEIITGCGKYIDEMHEFAITSQ